MMRNSYILILFFLSPFIQAQVGIGTTSPEQQLHVAGENSTIRFDYFNTVHSPLYNDGIKLAKVFVDGWGDLKLGDGVNSNLDAPINFLKEEFNFIPDNPYTFYSNTGKVINNEVGESYVEESFHSVWFNVPIESLIEVKYGITFMVRGSDLKLPPPYADVAYNETVKIGLYFCIDIGNNGLDADELSKRYGYNGQSYETEYGGIDGFSYMNSQGYLKLPSGLHRIYFFGVINDQTDNHTSVGYGGGMDYLKIRIYN